MLIIVAILVVVSLYIFTGEESILEEENEAGSWGIKAIIEYEDGTTKTMNTGDIGLSVKIENKIVDKITFHFMAKMEGLGYLQGAIDFTDVNVFATITSGELPFTIDYQGIITDDFEIITILVDNQWHTVLKQPITATHGFLEIHSPYKVGEPNIHRLEIKLVGNARYRGLPDGEWKSLTLPNPIGIMFEVHPEPIGNGDGKTVKWIYCDTKFDWN